MPKLVNYAARFVFLREAAFDVVLHEGVGALSRRSVAAALGTSVNTVRRLLSADADLVTLAADEVDRRRRHGRLGVPHEVEPVATAVHLLRKLLPDTEARVAEELVWLRLVLETLAVGDDPDRDGLVLRDRFRIAEGAYDGEPTARAEPATQDPLEHHRRQRDDTAGALVTEALDLTDAPQEARQADERELRALLSGLAVEVCLARLTPSDAVAVLDRAVRRNTVPSTPG